MKNREKQLITFALNFLEANTDSVSVQERLTEILGTSSSMNWEFAIDEIRESDEIRI